MTKDQLTTIYKDIFAEIEKASHVMMAMHRKPDGDTAGACLAFAHYLDLIKKPHTCFCIDDLSPTLNFLPGKHKMTSDEKHWEPSQAKFDLIIVFDSGDLGYNGIAPYVDRLTHDYKIINIDHHATNTRYGDINLVMPEASSTCEMVHDLIDYTGKLNKEMSTCLMTGLVTDTGGFTNLATTASSIDVGGKLLKKGVNLPHITQNTMKNRSFDSLKLWGRALERLQRSKHGIVTTVITQQDLTECHAEKSDVEGVANFLNSLDAQTDARAVVVLFEQGDGTIKGSMRTKHPLMNVARLATLLGGGGHTKAAGFTVAGTLEQHGDRWKIVTTST
jgi:phosphoesterase RecJ-like protein